MTSKIIDTEIGYKFVDTWDGNSQVSKTGEMTIIIHSDDPDATPNEIMENTPGIPQRRETIWGAQVGERDLEQDADALNLWRLKVSLDSNIPTHQESPPEDDENPNKSILHQVRWNVVYEERPWYEEFVWPAAPEAHLLLENPVGDRILAMTKKPLLKATYTLYKNATWDIRQFTDYIFSTPENGFWGFGVNSIILWDMADEEYYDGPGDFGRKLTIIFMCDPDPQGDLRIGRREFLLEGPNVFDKARFDLDGQKVPVRPKDIRGNPMDRANMDFDGFQVEPDDDNIYRWSFQEVRVVPNWDALGFDPNPPVRFIP